MRSYASAYLVTDSGGDKILMSNFINLFIKTFHENLSEKMILEMKHAVFVTNINDVKVVNVTPVMQLIGRIVSILENRRFINVTQLKNLLGLPPIHIFRMGKKNDSFTVKLFYVLKCAILGFPNLSALIQAHSDIFCTSTGSGFNERSDVGLRDDCICKCFKNVITFERKCTIRLTIFVCPSETFKFKYDSS